ncbi:ATP-dependent DNA helicase RecG [Candidatus Saccharibacteria bacterium]|nr:ATP-dependent DNA helicase RecG [Candidatus Saccharibacteria bacterium]MBR6122095.1 ATP-dependent DNA helicase RecG [Candidatus Saccharibacteria bacterium]
MSLKLTDSVAAIKGIGPKTEKILNKAGICTVRDLLYYLPRTYENFTTTTKLSDLRPGKVVIRGQISDLHTSRTHRRNLTITEGIIRDNTDAVRVVWFNQPYRAKQFIEGKDYYFTGNYDLSRGRYQLTSPRAELAADVDKLAGGNKFQPVYPVRGSFKSEGFRKIFETLRSEFAFIPDLLPKIKPGTRADALFKAHFAESDADVKAARSYLAYEELFELILASQLNKQENQKLRAEQIPFVANDIKRAVSSLKFNLTNAQRLATFEILKDLEKSTPMNRLLQGDVGSGKTVVAALAALSVAKAGQQTALLAPTAILASQHAESLAELLTPLGINVALLTGATKRKSSLKKHIKDGDVDLVVGTHALLTDDTEFKNLALTIIDEQHRFGVNQRQKLLEKTVARTGLAPHLLMMTATPIPRSLQLAIFGDLDISTLNELPKGRQPVTTKVIKEINFTDDLYPKVRAYLAKGQQVYWICKKIEEGGPSEAVSVKKQAEKLQKIFPKEKIAFLHGRMKPEEKDQIMQRFAENKIHILVSTTVVEVGVNVPNANIMVIMDAENYGLAQLHQLRGRVGRGQSAAECYLVSSADQPSRRLKELEKSTDGFYLAEADLKLRGPGEIYGSLQHGAMNLQFASLSDTHLIAAASKAAKAFAKTPDQLKDYPELMTCIKRYQQLTTLN